MSSSSRLLPLSLLLLLLSIAVETRSLPEADTQILRSLFGSRLAALLLAPPPSDDITEGSARPSAPATGSRGLVVDQDGRREAAPQLLWDFLRRQAKARRRSPKSMVGGAGCFGTKMDRIGSISGLGC
ncbi:C-type natriuretic peptide 2 [Cololabis saira]|uniref:C-type natriuretic peptide 2 n=1 Tax=Cololabis saira TaxID=129043 RepID=UPI002AD34805|nr:C-type natriuretic peptide 2 [Cololabis saira]